MVDHSGGQIIRGREHAWTLCFTDVKTGWTECVAVRNKAQVHVFAAIKRARQRLPFPLLGIDSDSGSEFINDQLYRYCLEEKITFTRGRAGRKNDNAYVEQKNWSVVRRAVGYWRYDSPEQLDLLNTLYARLHLYVNFFLPVMKLEEKVRHWQQSQAHLRRPADALCARTGQRRRFDEMTKPNYKRRTAIWTWSNCGNASMSCKSRSCRPYLPLR